MSRATLFQSVDPSLIPVQKMNNLSPSRTSLDSSAFATTKPHGLPLVFRTKRTWKHTKVELTLSTFCKQEKKVSGIYRYLRRCLKASGQKQFFIRNMERHLYQDLFSNS